MRGATPYGACPPPPEICAPYLDTQTHMTTSPRALHDRDSEKCTTRLHLATPAHRRRLPQTNVPHTKVQVDTTRFGLLSMHALCPTPHQDYGGQKSGRPSMLYAGRPRCRRRANESDQGEPQRTPRCALLSTPLSPSLLRQPPTSHDPQHGLLAARQWPRESPTPCFPTPSPHAAPTWRSFRRSAVRRQGRGAATRCNSWLPAAASSPGGYARDVTFM